MKDFGRTFILFDLQTNGQYTHVVVDMLIQELCLDLREREIND